MRNGTPLVLEAYDEEKSECLSRACPGASLTNGNAMYVCVFRGSFRRLIVRRTPAETSIGIQQALCHDEGRRACLEM
jgi:hypothetical protein